MIWQVLPRGRYIAENLKSSTAQKVAEGGVAMGLLQAVSAQQFTHSCMLFFANYTGEEVTPRALKGRAWGDSSCKKTGFLTPLSRQACFAIIEEIG